ncbi:hypothetical protein GTP46_25825 [Duganella sp. FT135W]|uniref:Uncharacterized protein n=1 Tax=Duganella flavida TaxID=2692175 RepID=A0A6L8KF19_9BURK|nr:hypothetical protein [Duganella flavida]MYM26053.1 hypothetical protein [Duganella flavida]
MWFLFPSTDRLQAFHRHSIIALLISHTVGTIQRLSSPSHRMVPKRQFNGGGMMMSLTRSHRSCFVGLIEKARFGQLRTLAKRKKFGSMTRYFFPILLMACSTGYAWADEPLPSPETQTVCSISGRFCATADIHAQTTSLRVKSTGELLGVVPGWHRWIFVSDDGETIAIGYEGMNLVPRSVTLAEPIILLYSRNKLVRTVVLGDLFDSIVELTPTMSHYAWGSIQSFNKSNQLVVSLVTGSYFAIPVHTGKLERVHFD